jgi:hypothetical protein
MSDKLVKYDTDFVTGEILRLLEQRVLSPNCYGELERRFVIGDKVLRLVIDGRKDIEDDAMRHGLHSVSGGVYDLSKRESLGLWGLVYARSFAGQYFELQVHPTLVGQMEALGLTYIEYTDENIPECDLFRRLYFEFLRERPRIYKSPFAFRDVNGNPCFIGPLENLLKIADTDLDFESLLVRRFKEGRSMGDIGLPQGPLEAAFQEGGECEWSEGKRSPDKYLFQFNETMDLDDLIGFCDAVYQSVMDVQSQAGPEYVARQLEEFTRTFSDPQYEPRRYSDSSVQEAYAALGLSADASQKDVKERFRSMAVEVHPDMHPGSDPKEWEEKFKSIQNAYSILMDTFRNKGRA